MRDVTATLDRLREAARRTVREAVRTGGPPPRPSGRARLFDALVAVVLGVVTVFYGIDNSGRVVWREIAPGVVLEVARPSGPEGTAFMVGLAAVASGALVLRRRYPLGVLCVVTAATAATPQSVLRLTLYAFVIAVYSAAVYGSNRVATLVALPVAIVLVGSAGNSATPVVPNEYIVLLILVPMALAAVGLRTWKLRTDEGRARLAALERERDEALRRAVEHERARIARELHDVVTHNVSVMLIQAGAARTIMRTSPEQAGEALLAVEAGGRAAMTELRNVMGLLTMPDGDGRPGGEEPDDADAELTPQPGLDRLEELVGRVRSTGVPVALTVTGTPRALPPGVELAAYRVVQEALTNAVKHASGASATVTVAHTPHHLRVEVTDTGGRPDADAAAGNGRGLIGLRERLSVYGGTLTAGPPTPEGFRVEALIPLDVP
ncbi:sensor histidine kinase [Streptomyces sp. NPDC001478]